MARAKAKLSVPPTVDELLNPTADQLIAEFLRLKEYMATEAKRFNEFMAPHKARQEHVSQQLHQMLNALGGDDRAKLSTESGTAYLSHITTPKIVDREKYLDACLDNWETYGNEMLQIGAPQVTAVKNFIDTNQTPPPGVEISVFTRVNINKA